MAAGRVNVASWLLTLITWDGLLPAAILFAPTAVELLVPKKRGAIEFVAVVLPIAAFFLRLTVGMRRIRSNHCGRWFRAFQATVFFAGIFWLAIIDALVIGCHEFLKQMRFDALFLSLAIMGAPYFVTMAIAMYPGKVESQPEWSPYQDDWG